MTFPAPCSKSQASRQRASKGATESRESLTCHLRQHTILAFLPAGKSPFAKRPDSHPSLLFKIRACARTGNSTFEWITRTATKDLESLTFRGSEGVAEIKETLKKIPATRN